MAEMGIRGREHMQQGSDRKTGAGEAVAGGPGKVVADGTGEAATGREQSKRHCSLLDPSPTYHITVQRQGLPRLGEHPRLCPLLQSRQAETKRKKKKAQMKEQIKAPEKIQLSNKEIGNLSDAQFKTLVIRKLTDMVEFDHKLEGKMKAMLSEIKENVQRTNSDGKETRTQINGVDQKEA